MKEDLTRDCDHAETVKARERKYMLNYVQVCYARL